MPANIGFMFSGSREVPWHKQGTVVEGQLNADDMLTTARLDWPVELRELLALPRMPGDLPALQEHVNEVLPTQTVRVTPATGHVATVRIDAEGREHILGVVGSRYRPIQNSDMAQFAEAIMEVKGEAIFETAGWLGNGEYVWMLARLDRSNVMVAGVDEIIPYFLIVNAHDGTAPLRALLTPVRVVCQNTLNMALAGAKNIYGIRHTAGAERKVAEATRVLGLVVDYYKQFQAIAESLAMTQYTMPDLRELAEFVYPAVESKLSPQASNGRLELEAVYDVEGQRTPKVAGTAWAAYNAVAELKDHRPTKTNSSKLLESIWWGNRAAVKQEALSFICKQKGIEAPDAETE